MKPDERSDHETDDARFERTVRNLLRTPPKPHKAGAGEQGAEKKRRSSRRLLARRGRLRRQSADR